VGRSFNEEGILMDDIFAKLLTFFTAPFSALLGVYVGYILKKKSDDDALLRNVNAVKCELNHEIDYNWKELRLFLRKVCDYQGRDFDPEVDSIQIDEIRIREGSLRFPDWEMMVWEDKRFLLVQGVTEDEFNRVAHYYRLLRKVREKLENPHERLQAGWFIKEILENGKPTLLKTAFLP
jgi:hypothetical protein